MTEATGRLVRVVAPHFVAGMVMGGDTCVRAAPILSWAIGKRRDELRSYFARKGWKATEATNDARGRSGSYQFVPSCDRAGDGS